MVLRERSEEGRSCRRSEGGIKGSYPAIRESSMVVSEDMVVDVAIGIVDGLSSYLSSLLPLYLYVGGGGVIPLTFGQDVRPSIAPHSTLVLCFFGL